MPKYKCPFFQPRRELVETYILIEEYDLALDLVSINYKKYPDNIFNIYQYFNCLIRQKAPDLEKISELLNKAKDIDRLPTSSKKFYANMKSLYERFITHDKEKAIRILIKNKSVFDNLIYYYRDLFDLYLETKNVKKMQEVFEYLKKTIDDDLSFSPLLFRRECALLYFQTNDFILVSNRITVSNAISSTTKDKIRAYLKTLKI